MLDSHAPVNSLGLHLRLSLKLVAYSTEPFLKTVRQKLGCLQKTLQRNKATSLKRKALGSLREFWSKLNPLLLTRRGLLSLKKVKYITTPKYFAELGLGHCLACTESEFLNHLSITLSLLMMLLIIKPLDTVRDLLPVVLKATFYSIRLFVIYCFNATRK